MPKPNRGNTIKLSIRLSEKAKQKIKVAAHNLGVSQANVILFELTKILKNPPAINEIEAYENDITLERDHFVLTVNEVLMERVNALAEDYQMKKNILIGYLVSKEFEDAEDQEAEENVEPRKILVQVNEQLKKKMMEFSEENFLPLNLLVSYSILNGPVDRLPNFLGSDANSFFTNVPAYIYEMIKERSKEEMIREHFYTALCLYKQVMIPEGRFY